MPRCNPSCVGIGVCLGVAWAWIAATAVGQGYAPHAAYPGSPGIQHAPPQQYAAAPPSHYAAPSQAAPHYAQQQQYAHYRSPQGQPIAHSGSQTSPGYQQPTAAQPAAYPPQYHAAPPQQHLPAGYQAAPPQQAPQGYQQPAAAYPPQQPVHRAVYAQPVAYSAGEASVPEGPRVHQASYAAPQPLPQMQYAQPMQAYPPQPGYGAANAYYVQQPVVAGPPPQPYGAQQVVYVQPATPQLLPGGGYPQAMPVAMVDPNVMPVQYSFPGVPGTSAAGAAAVPGASSAAAPTGGIAGCFSGLCQIGSQLKSCWCKSALGQMFGTIIAPVSGLTGGIIPQCCANPTASDLAQPGAQGAASAIQKNAAEAKARREAVKYLGTVDCHWFPEAETGLIGALRADPIECVRWEAAHQLRNGCCCTKKVIEALRICVQGTSEDGNPSENSPRVRAEALIALQECLSCGENGNTPVQPELPTRPENPDVLAALSSYYHATGYYREALNNRSRDQVVADARALVARVRHVRLSSQPPRGQRSLMEIWNYAGRPQPAEPGDDPNEPLRPVPQPNSQPQTQPNSPPQPQPAPEPAPRPEPRALYTTMTPSEPAEAAPAATVQRLPSPGPSSQQAQLPGESAFGPAPRTAAEPKQPEQSPVLR